MNGALFQWQLYNESENRIYNKMASSESVYWMDAGQTDDEVLEVKINKGVAEVLGYTCDELVLTCKSGLQKYYFNSQLALDPQLFARHKFGNWSAYVSLAKALPLKSIIENKQFVYESVAVDIKPMQLDKNIFVLEKGMKVEKSPF
ncbi:hypothetical protein [Pontibacter sp. 172403-2]|uniref:hypothetical protein n=1 Tax=Pontibacter rufus TaxID=2791028 RepID=UPI001E28EF13|nr:hypothetical protein [Pontibacter sp. 172403-2]